MTAKQIKEAKEENLIKDLEKKVTAEFPIVNRFAKPENLTIDEIAEGANQKTPIYDRGITYFRASGRNYCIDD